MSRLSVSIEMVGAVLVLRIVGNASAVDCDVLDRKVREVAVLRPRKVVVDLAEVTFISSTAISLLAHLHRELGHEGGGQIVLAAARPAIAEVIRCCRISDLLPMVESVETAAAAGV